MADNLPAPEAVLISRMEWDYFITLTHAPQGSGKFAQPSQTKQKKRFVKWLRIASRKTGQHLDDLYWVKRWEVGRGGREHFHALFRFYDRSLVHKTTKYRLKHIWESVLGYGIADVRDIRTMGVQAYITKIQNEYELNRFGSERFRHVEFSKSALKAFRRQLRQGSLHTGVRMPSIVPAGPAQCAASLRAEGVS